jgi:hypothetical protein
MMKPPNITKSPYNDMADFIGNGEERFYAYKYDVRIVGTTDADSIFGDYLLTNEYGASHNVEINQCDQWKTVAIRDGAFSYEETVYSNINATEVIIGKLSTSEE